MVEEIRKRILKDTLTQRELMTLEHRLLHQRMTRLNITGGLSKESQKELTEVTQAVNMLKEKLDGSAIRLSAIKELWGLDEQTEV